ncbi:MAG: arginine deiminase [Bacteroidales bacterium]|nr:arginine deiminase [Bacteroidales bacterium]
MIELNIKSETAKLKAVLLHEPGPEVENMTPTTAERALYSDILNLSVASREYSQFKEVLKRVSKVYELKDLLIDVLKNEDARNEIIQVLTAFSRYGLLPEQLNELSAEELGRQIIEGVPYSSLSLSSFLLKEKYLISPLHNAFYMRDPSFILGKAVFVSSMAKQIRVPEALVMRSIFKHHSEFDAEVISIRETAATELHPISIEGGDVIALSDDTLILGIGNRTSVQAADALIKQIANKTEIKSIFVQELPDQPESFIHLDMVFTLLDNDECMVYKPLILDENRYHTVHIQIRNQEVYRISYVNNLLEGLKKVGYNLHPLYCGGKEKKYQDREQWHSGANLFAFGPGQLIAYERNIYTLEELSDHQYEIVKAADFVKDSQRYANTKKLIVTIEGSELSRGGGGARCMTLPLVRE